MKSYIVEFTHRVSGNTFLKFGHTKYSDVMKRFEFNPEQYQDYVIQVLASIKHNTLEEAESVESDFLEKYPKNLSLPRNFSGITETYKPEDKQERVKILREFYTLKERVEKKMVTSEDINDATQKRFIDKDKEKPLHFDFWKVPKPDGWINKDIRGLKG